MWTRGRRSGADLQFDLEPRGYRDTDITLQGSDDAAPGQYPVCAELTLAGDIPPAWRQTVEDVCIITVGDVDDDLVCLVGDPQDIAIDRGRHARLTATVASASHGDSTSKRI